MAADTPQAPASAAGAVGAAARAGSAAAPAAAPGLAPRAARPLRLAPSILSADFARLADEVARIEAGGCDWVHVDVMDGHFVPNLTIGPPVVKALARVAKVPLDVHIMIAEPERYAQAFCDSGASVLTFHVEAAKDAVALCERIRGFGARAGVAIRPRTPLAGLEPALRAADLVLVMTVEPGFGGQSFMADQMAKLRAVYDLVGGEKDIEVDGGLNAETVETCAAHGANAIVAGNFVFAAADVREPLERLRAGFARGAARLGR